MQVYPPTWVSRHGQQHEAGPPAIPSKWQRARSSVCHREQMDELVAPEGSASLTDVSLQETRDPLPDLEAALLFNWANAPEGQRAQVPDAAVFEWSDSTLQRIREMRPSRTVVPDSPENPDRV